MLIARQSMVFSTTRGLRSCSQRLYYPSPPRSIRSLSQRFVVEKIPRLSSGGVPLVVSPPQSADHRKLNHHRSLRYPVTNLFEHFPLAPPLPRARNTQNKTRTQKVRRNRRVLELLHAVTIHQHFQRFSLTSSAPAPRDPRACPPQPPASSAGSAS